MTEEKIKEIKDLIKEVGFERFEDNVIRLIGTEDGICDLDVLMETAILKYQHIHSKILDDYCPTNK
nr:MAG TPA: hypothetical protein [Bacteriophage sp.]